jgi:hypothetical protein
MIYTVTLDPALDRFIVVEQLLTEETTRILSETPYAVGKGIDVSRVIRWWWDSCLRILGAKTLRIASDSTAPRERQPRKRLVPSFVIARICKI